MTKLYELTGNYLAVRDMLDEGMPVEAVQDTLESIEGEIEVKAENLLHVVSNYNADVSALDTEIKRLQKRKTAVQNKQQQLRDYLKFNMQESGIKKISCPLYTITLAKGRDIALIEDAALIPPRFCTKPEPQPRKKDILAALKDGKKVPGAVLGKSEESLRIR